MLAAIPFEQAWPMMPARALRHFEPDAVLEAYQADAQDRGAFLICEDGIVAVKTVPDDNGGRQLFVLLAAATGARGGIKRQEPALLALARLFGCTEVAFKTHRARAWRRVLPAAWVQRGDEFSRSLG